MCGEVELLMTLEAKIDESFPKSQLIKSFNDPFRIDWNVSGQVILLYLTEGIPIKLLSTEPLLSESFFV